MLCRCLVLLALLCALTQCVHAPPPPPPADFSQRICEPIRIDMCRSIGYNETAMPNLAGHELQTDVEFTLQTFAPLIEYVCSTQLKLFLCAAYVPMCTPKVPLPIGPCRSLCESVRSRCHPVLQGFGFSWPSVLDCSRFPRENNHETMCMEGPGESMHVPMHEHDVHPALGPHTKVTATVSPLECPSHAKYVKLHRSGSCALLCEADALFTQHSKHLAEVWVTTWSYAALGLAAIATLCMLLSNDDKHSSKWARVIMPLVWCHDMVAIGWTVRFVSGRNATACGYDPQLPNVSLLLVDGLSNAACASTFILRYYFGMAACAWWAILCLGWHRDVRLNSPDADGHVAFSNNYASAPPTAKRSTANASRKKNPDITHSNLARFVAWGLPAFQTAAVIVARLVDADELLGACFVGNQSEKGLQILVATPLFCYWIFGSVNLVSGYLVHRRSKELLKNLNSAQLQHQLKSKNSGIGTFLFIYCVPCALLLMAVIYEFVNIDIWRNVSVFPLYSENTATPLWPFLTRAFTELMLGIICFAWVLGPKISTMYKRQLTPPATKAPAATSPSTVHGQPSSRSSHAAYSTVSYHTVRHHSPHSQPMAGAVMSLNQMSNYSLPRNKCPPHVYANRCDYKMNQSFQHYGNETIL